MAEGQKASLEGRRIVFVFTWAVLGGAERQALLVARHLREVEGADVEICALTGEEGRAAKLCRELGIRWRSVPVSWAGSRAAKAGGLASLAARLRRSRPDALVPYCALPNVLCGLVWRWTGASLCVWNQADVSPIRRVGPRLARRAVRNTPLRVSNSRHGAEFAVSTLGARRERVRVIPNGIDLPPAQAGRGDWRARLGASGDDFLVCMLAHLHRFKDHATLLRAWQLVAGRLEQQGRRAVLLLAGRPAGTEDALKALAFDLELGAGVRFLGDVADVSGLLSAVDTGVLSSPREGCPNAVLECMAAGLAVAGSDIPGIREAVGEDGYPFLAPPGEPEPLADAILRLAGDPQLRATLGARNRERIRAEFGAERLLEQSTALLAEGLAARGRRRERVAYPAARWGSRA